MGVGFNDKKFDCRECCRAAVGAAHAALSPVERVKLLLRYTGVAAKSESWMPTPSAEAGSAEMKRPAMAASVSELSAVTDKKFDCRECCRAAVGAGGLLIRNSIVANVAD